MKILQERLLPEQPNPKFWLLSVLFIAVCVIVYTVHWPALSAKALSFDDNQYLTENVLVQNPSWASVKRFLTEILEPTTVYGYYQPLTMISLMLDYALGGRENNLMPFHRTSLILHTANTALIIVLLYLLFENVWAAAAAGLLFGVHPMTVEPIPWVGERKTLLAAFFALWCLILYVRYAQKSDKKFYIGCMVMYVLALMSKPTSTPLPLVMLLMDFWPLKRAGSKSRIIFEKFPLFAIGALSAVVTYISQSRTAVTVLPSQFGFERVPLVLCHNIIFYLYKMVWPANLSSHYAFPEMMSLANPMMLAGVISTCILIPLLVISLRWTRAAFTGWLIFFVAILPTMQVIGFSNVIASDKFAYLPSVGLLMLLCYFLVWLFKTGRTAVVITTAVVVISAGAEAFTTRQYLVHWRDTVSLCEYMLSLTPNAASVHNLLGFALQSQEKYEQAIKHYRRAIELKLDYPEVYSNLGNALSSVGKSDEAIEYYQKALQINPNYANAHYNLGILFKSQGKLDEAIRHYRLTIDIKPDHIKAYNNLGNILRSQGKLSEAISCYQRALRIKPDFSEALNNIGAALELQGKPNEAVSYYQRTIQANPYSVDAHYNLANALWSQGRFDDAVGQYRQVLRIQPNNADAYYGIGFVFQLQNRFDDAINYYRQALKINPNNAKANYGVGVILSEQGRLNEAVNYFQQAVHTEPNSVEMHNSLGNALLAEGKLDDAIIHYRKALQIKPDYAKVHNNLGYALQLQKKIDEAINYYRRALQIEPDSAEAHNNLANALSAQGKRDEAISRYRKAIQIKPDYTDACYNLGNALQSQGKLDEAVECYRRVLQLNPNDFETHNTLGKVLQSQGKPDEALSHYQLALKIRPDYVSSLNGTAEILATHPDPKKRDVMQAVALAEKAASLTKYQNPIVLQTLAATYAAAGKYDEAVKTAQAALALATAAKNNKLIEQLNKQLEIYRSKCPQQADK